ncbi:hypothetical protein [Castellaniella sp. GW247-6E4]|uniref:hypothetical protein n=1 Tax=Castellaniella sp. GW247-6E4 TaxID=3140380 RepID=UPI003314E6D7
MSKNNKMSDRLTWDSHAPAPYESAWSVFLKILSINCITMRELEELIEREPVKNKSGLYRNYLNGDWIDFDRYATLLGVAAERLKDGFLDQLGIAPVGSFDLDIRHCPYCDRLGYHCVLFQLSMIDECPWHRCKLVKSCGSCDSLRPLSPIQSTCISCGKSLDNFISAPRFNALDNALKYAVIGYCREFIDWWAEVEAGTSCCPSFTNALLRIRRADQTEMQFAQWQLGFVRKITKKELFWKFSIREKPAHVISRSCLINKDESLQRHYFSDDIGHSYRSIRRHIYKKYLRPHHACIHHLVNLSRNETLYLHSEKTCLPAVAFLAWRMSVEGICNIEGLRSPKGEQVPLRLMQPSTWPFSLAGGDQLRWTYDGFFGLLAALEDTHERHWRIIVAMNDYLACDGFLQSRLIEDATSPADETSTVRSGVVQILCPEVACLAEKSCAKWRALTRSSDRSMCDQHAFDQAMTWSWATNPGNSHKNLFKLTQNERFGRPTFEYFNV